MKFNTDKANLMMKVRVVISKSKVVLAGKGRRELPGKIKIF